MLENKLLIIEVYKNSNIYYYNESKRLGINISQSILVIKRFKYDSKKMGCCSQVIDNLDFIHFYREAKNKVLSMMKSYDNHIYI